MRDPGPSFSTSWYLDKYRDVKRAGMNPLVHYLRYGQKEGRLPAPATAQRPWWEGLRPSSGTAASSVAFGETLTRLRKSALPPAVIVPVYNAAKEVDECLEALLTHTRGQARIIIIDDASPAPEVKEVLSRYEAEGSVEIYRNENNLGFTRTVNRGIELAGRADVVFLNSDTKVTPGWLLNLRVAAYSGEKIGTVTPLSNNAGAFSAPEIGKNNELPKWLTLDEYARAITHASARLRPSTPTGNGFCMYVRRDCLDEVGLLDANAFPRGYGEENDLCMRAVRKGWSHIVDDSTLIYHVRSASFGEEKVRLMAEGRAVVDQRYPEYGELVKKFVSGEPLKLARQRVHDIQRTLASSKQVALPRVLFVLSTRTGGTPQTNQDLMQALDDRVEAFVLRCNATILTLSHFRDGVYTEVERHILSNPLKAFPHRSDEYDAVVGEWMVRYAIELVHVRHIGWHGLGLIEVAKTLGRPVVFSFHDFYTVCPTVKLLDDKNEYCGGVCTASRGECRHELWPSRGFPALKGAAITQWRTSMEEVLKLCDVFITTAESAKEIISRTYPFLRERPFHVIPHGRDFDRFEKLTPQIESDTKIRIVIPGNISVAKGGKIIEELGRRASEENLEIHVLGDVGVDVSLPTDVISHGVYAREKFADRIREIRPHIGGVFSIWPETYCHTLTELWSCGIPVIAFDYGAVGDRMKESGAGWLVQEKNASDVINVLRRLREDPAEYARGVECVVRWQNIVAPRSTCLLMSHAYYDIYRSLVLRKDWEERPRVAVVSHAELRDGSIQASASTHVRLLQ
ncbi:glycosyltransferase family 2 protein, partial [Parvibaculum sp.]|uniref:glycosyltransferase family 2 protein n=1 Tax=Parvibaculum sp. TaxID=2024848 RepID=UPI003C724D47